MSLASGAQLGPYEIVALLGVGGMGEVYRARDPRLGRDVAVKIFPSPLSGDSTRLRRFEQEARAAAALNHPNICQLYDIGPDYLVMEFIDGQPLQSPLPLEDALRLAIQIATALEEAHRRGVIHRDLKPANIMVTAAGVAKVLDFGLAKLVTRGDPEVTRTQEGTVLGTVAYMAPEQAEGKPPDARSDVFSFGAVLYEMFSGRRAFAGESTARVVSAVLRDTPPPLQTPGAVARAVARCLAKHPEDRFQTMAEVRAALEEAVRKTSTGSDGPPSIAVLPFANMSADPENEYFSDGLAEEIINALAQVPGLKVIARTSAFAFKGKHEDIRRIAEALGVDHVIEGSVRKAGNRIRVTAQLISALDGSHLWSKRYDREMADVFAIQDEIAGAIAAALQPKLPARPAATRRHTPNLSAYEAFLRGRYFMGKLTPSSLARSRECLEQAIALDESFARAHSELGMYFICTAGMDMLPAGKALPSARAAAQKALEIDPSLPEAQAMLGAVAAVYDYDWKEVERRNWQDNARRRVPRGIALKRRIVLHWTRPLLGTPRRHRGLSAVARFARQLASRGWGTDRADGETAGADLVRPACACS